MIKPREVLLHKYNEKQKKCEKRKAKSKNYQSGVQYLHNLPAKENKENRGRNHQRNDSENSKGY